MGDFLVDELLEDLLEVELEDLLGDERLRVQERLLGVPLNEEDLVVVASHVEVGFSVLGHHWQVLEVPRVFRDLPNQKLLHIAGLHPPESVDHAQRNGLGYEHYLVRVAQLVEVAPAVLVLECFERRLWV